MRRHNSCPAVSTPYSLMDLTPENLERLLNWLHPNREEAGLEYERIRALLMKHFEAHGYASVADKLADATMDRTAETITDEQIENWVGKKERIFFRVGYYILLEYVNRRLQVEELPDDLNVPTPEPDKDIEVKADCLEQCLQQLEPEHQWIVAYYRGTKAEKKKNRQELARKMGVTLAVLRVKALRIRKTLKPCIRKCIEEARRAL